MLLYADCFKMNLDNWYKTTNCNEGAQTFLRRKCSCLSDKCLPYFVTAVPCVHTCTQLKNRFMRQKKCNSFTYAKFLRSSCSTSFKAKGFFFCSNPLEIFSHWLELMFTRYRLFLLVWHFDTRSSFRILSSELTALLSLSTKTTKTSFFFGLYNSEKETLTPSDQKYVVRIVSCVSGI